MSNGRATGARALPAHDAERPADVARNVARGVHGPHYDPVAPGRNRALAPAATNTHAVLERVGARPTVSEQREQSLPPRPPPLLQQQRPAPRLAPPNDHHP